MVYVQSEEKIPKQKFRSNSWLFIIDDNRKIPQTSYCCEKKTDLSLGWL